MRYNALNCHQARCLIRQRQKMSQFRPEESGGEGIDSASDIIELRSDFEIYREMRDNPIKFRRSRNMGRDQEHIPGGQRINNILKNDLCAVCLIPVETPVLPEIPGIIPLIMESELDSPPTNSELCRRVNMSRNSFYRLFMRETKKTPNFFLFELRMLRASWLLHHTEKTMDEIAQETGYADRYHFSKAFKNFSGVPPVHYRRERQGT